MDTTQSMTMRLETYLLQLSDINQRWMRWLGGAESAALKSQPERLVAMHNEAESLVTELQEIVAGRARILSSAQEAGWSVSSLGSLARQLPVWKRPRFRAAFESTKQQLQQLRRLHIATWVLLGQSANFCQDVTLLLMSGTTNQDVYLADAPRDTGGQLLDAQL